ncbi:glycine cleavage T C-terminal barrel domain-containing protein [Streptomyces sp. bgisy100]|uniref:glycine cleavage T C-terminal barrel domain-containing protein n=1 Tax=Streptomyces sp. bgisy100 TaxID=3413783 RepID=UPI003D736FBD
MSKKTPLHAVHTELGATFTDCGGWSMPLRYTSELAEHHAVRTTAGLFDLTHLGEVEVSGPEAGRALDHALAGQPSRIAVGRGCSTVLVHETGGVLDDLVVHRLAETRYLIVANAGNAMVVLSQLRDRVDGYAATIRNASGDRALIAVQGPASPEIVGEVADRDVVSLEHNAITPARLADREVLLARTGGTGGIGGTGGTGKTGGTGSTGGTGGIGEDGFGIHCRPADAEALWRALSAAGTRHGLLPCGLAGRYTLRLEAGTPSCGRELTARTTPFEAGLGHAVTFGKPGGFVGEAALAALRDQGPTRVLVGLASTGRRAPRTGCAVLAPDTGEHIGEVTSGALSPTLGHPVALAYLRTDRSAPGTEVLVDIRGGHEHARVVELPFHRRPA